MYQITLIRWYDPRKTMDVAAAIMARPDRDLTPTCFAPPDTTPAYVKDVDDAICSDPRDVRRSGWRCGDDGC
jgi:hypothetical protein